MTATATVASRSVFYASALCGALLAAYVALMVTTIVFASLQTQLARSIQDTQMEITKLESQYYDAISSLDSVDPHALGYVTPHAVRYVAATPVSGLTFAQ